MLESSQWSDVDAHGKEYEGKYEAIYDQSGNLNRCLRITDVCLKRFPTGIAVQPNQLPIWRYYLTVLQISNCGLESIAREDLAGLSKIEELDLTGNKLKSLPDDLF